MNSESSCGDIERVETLSASNRCMTSGRVNTTRKSSLTFLTIAAGVPGGATRANHPDAANPGSDPCMTAFAIVLLREGGVPASDRRIRRGVAWLKENQRASGRWWMHSLYRGNYNYITYISTAQALRALALCDELPTTTSP